MDKFVLIVEVEGEYQLIMSCNSSSYCIVKFVSCIFTYNYDRFLSHTMSHVTNIFHAFQVHVCVVCVDNCSCHHTL